MKQATTRVLTAALSTTALFALGAPAYAQDAAADDGASDGTEIIVSARRRDETLQSTPVAITAINAAMIENKGAVNIGDLMGSAPNLLITNQNSGAAAANLSIRGLTFADIEKSFDPTVAVNVDGVFLGTSTGQFFDFFDIDQLEVLRGPQGTLFGRNTIGGVINIRRSKPKDEFSGKVEASYGKYATMALKGILNAPIGEGGSAVKVWYLHNESDGYYRNAVNGKRAGGSNNENFGAAFLLKAGDFDALLTAEKQVQSFNPVIANIAKTGEAFCNFEPAAQCNRNTTSDIYTVFQNDVLGKPTYSHYKTPAVTLELNGDLGAVKLTSVTGWRKSTEDQTQDFDGSSVDLYHTRRQQKFRQWSQELRAAGKLSDSFDYVVGGYYYNGRYTLVQNTRLFGLAEPTIGDPLGLCTALGGPAVSGCGWLGGAPTLANAQVVSGTAKSLAFFGDFNLALADKFRINFGGRWTHDKKSIDNFFFAQLGAASRSFNKFTPKVSVDFRPNDDHMVYASWSRGYRSGGFSNRAQTSFSTTAAFGPETVDSYELGLKSSLADGMFQVNLAAFYSDYKDLQQNTTIPGGPTGNETIVSNVGSAKVKGVEGDFTFRASSAFKITGSFGIIDNKFKGFITQAPNPASTPANPLRDNYDYSALDMIYAPKLNASLNAEYKADVGFGELVANVGYRYVDRYDQQIASGTVALLGSNPDGSKNYEVTSSDPRVRTDKQGLLDASLTAKFDLSGAKAHLTVYGRNLADDRGMTHGFTVAGLWSFATAREPRTFGATLGVEF